MLYGDETLKKINEKEENAYDNKGDCAACTGIQCGGVALHEWRVCK